MTLPRAIRDSLRERLWEAADRLEWAKLAQGDKARHYEVWTKDPSIGGVINRYIDGGKVRVYIKDTLLKSYGRSKLADPERPLRSIGVDPSSAPVAEYIKPHGRRLNDGRIVCWGRADDWKDLLMALHERSYVSSGRPYAAVLLSATGKYYELRAREMVEDAAKKLGIEQLRWIE